VDTSAWYARADPRDGAHARAIAGFASLAAAGRLMVLSNHIVAETYVLLRKRRGVEAALGFLRALGRSPAIHKIHVPESWETEAEELLAKYRAHVLSYVDATSMVVMQRLGMRDALSFDLDFSIAGFNLLHH